MRQLCVKLTLGSWRISERVSRSFPMLLQLAMLYMPRARSYTRPNLNRRLNFCGSTRGSRKAFLFKTTMLHRAPLEFVHFRQKVNFFRCQLKPCKCRCCFLFRYHDFEEWNEVFFGCFAGHMALFANFCADAIQHGTFAFSPEQRDDSL